MPYQGVAFALLLGVGLATAAVLYFLGQREPESPHRTYEPRSPQNESGCYSNPWEQQQRPGNVKRRRRGSLQSDSTSCTICFEDMIEDVKSLPCKHKFHSKCVNRWLSQEPSQGCPLCRKSAI